MNFLLFEKIGLSRDAVKVYIGLYELGAQPASIIAKHIHMERTKTYRYLMHLVELSLIRKTTKNGVQTFYIQDIGDIEKAFDKHIADLEFLKQEKPKIIQDLKNLNKKSASILPRISIYDGTHGVGNIFDDIEGLIESEQYKLIRMFATNTYLERHEDDTTGKYANSFFENLHRKNIHIDTYLGSGNMIMERIQHLANSFDLRDIPATQSSINLIIVGKTVYIVMYDRVPIGIKIENDTVGDIFHLLLDTIDRSNQV